MFRDVYFLNYKELTLKLINDEISDFQAAKHFVFSLVLSGITISLPFEFTGKTLFSNYLELVLIPLGLVCGVLICYHGGWSLYHANSNGDDRDFFKRIACLTLPVSICLGLIASAVLFSALLSLGFQHKSIYDVFEFIIEIIYLLAYFWLMRKCIYFISMREKILSNNKM